MRISSASLVRAVFLTIGLSFGLSLCGLQVAHAVQPDEILSNPALEQRARDISEGLRCLVCQNESIDDSNAPLARDLRILVRQKLKQGLTNAQVVDYIEARYGEFVLLRPRFVPHNYLLWFAAPLVLLLGAVLIFFSYRRRAATPPPQPLDAREKRRLKQMLDQA